MKAPGGEAGGLGFGGGRVCGVFRGFFRFPAAVQEVPPAIGGVDEMGKNRAFPPSASPGNQRKKPRNRGFEVERETRLELATFSLGS